MLVIIFMGKVALVLGLKRWEEFCPMEIEEESCGWKKQWLYEAGKKRACFKMSEGYFLGNTRTG